MHRFDQDPGRASARPAGLAVLAALALATGLAAAPLVAQDGAAPEEEPLPPVHVPRPVADGRPTHLEGWEELECAECHREIVGEWATTLHALAWVDPHYQEAIADRRRPQSCWGCHIPEPVHAGPIGRKILPRQALEDLADPADFEPREHGITCKTCHLGPSGEMLGPWPGDEAKSEHHDSAQGEHFVSGDALCLACHRTNVGPVIGIGKDFETTRQADKGLSCVGCHMQAVDRPIAVVPKDGGEAEPGPVRRGRSHTLQTPRDPVFLASAFGLDVQVRPEGPRLVVSNQAGHRVPGLKTRTMTFTARALDAAGEELARAVLLVSSDAWLPADGAVVLDVPAEGAAALHVVGDHDWTGIEGPVRFLDRVLDLP